MKQKKLNQEIKNNGFTKFVLWLAGIFGIVLMLAGMIYSYTNLVDLAAKYSYQDNPLKALFWPLFTEGLLITLGFLVLAIKLNQWPSFNKFKWGLYSGSLFVVIVNTLYTGFTVYNITLDSVVNLIVNLTPVFVYLIFVEIGLYLIENGLIDKVESQVVKTEVITQAESTKNLSISEQSLQKTNEIDNARQAKLVNLEQQKHLVKSFLIQALESGLQVSQQDIADIFTISRQTVVNYRDELLQENAIVKEDRGVYSVNGNSEVYKKTDVSGYIEMVKK